MKRPCPWRPAFTLVETIAVIVVLSLIASVASSVMMTGADAYAGLSVQAQLLAEADVALNRLARELRQIGPDLESDEPAPDITAASRTSLRWSDAASLSLVDGRIVLIVNDDEPRILATDVSNLELDFFDGNNRSLLAGAAVPDNRLPAIRRISFALTVSRAGRTETLRTKVFIRSMMAGGSG